MHPDRATTYEHRDARAKPIVITGVAIVLLCVAGLVGAALVTSGFERRTTRGYDDPSPLFTRDVPTKAPLLTDEPAWAAEYVASQNERLRSYGWVDADRGTVHIPIERAMELEVKEAQK